MANAKISNFPLASALSLDDLFAIADGTTTSKSTTPQQFIDLTNISGLLETGSLVAGAITFPKIQDISTNSFLGRDTGGTGPVEELSAANARNVLNVENGADVTDEANVKSALDGATISNVTVSGSDKVLIQDVSNSDNLRTVTALSIADLSPNGTVTSIASGTGLLGGPITTTGTLSVDVGTTANKIVQLDGSAKLPAVDGSQLTNLPAAGGGLLAANNLSDVASASTSRSNLSVPSNAEALLGSNNLSDVNNVSTSRSNLNVPSNSEALLGSNNLNDVNNASTSRSNLGLGTAATKNFGTASGQLPQNSDLGTASLEPYESGSWTPILEDFSFNQATMAASTIGRYTRIGDNVTVYCEVKTTSLGSVSGGLRVSGLPFTALKLGCSMASSDASSLDVSIAEITVTAKAAINEARLRLQIWFGTTGTVSLDALDWTADGGCFFAGSYFIG